MPSPGPRGATRLVCDTSTLPDIAGNVIKSLICPVNPIWSVFRTDTHYVGNLSKRHGLGLPE